MRRTPSSTQSRTSFSDKCTVLGLQSPRQEQCSLPVQVFSDLCDTGGMPAPSLRDRVRSEMNQEIKEVARRHLAAEGANLSLRGVARDMGIVASALYRYFPSRDALLTALIIDAYEALGTAATDAEAAVPREDLRGRWLAVCRAARTWALSHPAEYGLLYGNPVP